MNIFSRSTSTDVSLDTLLFGSLAVFCITHDVLQYPDMTRFKIIPYFKAEKQKEPNIAKLKEKI